MAVRHAKIAILEAFGVRPNCDDVGSKYGDITLFLGGEFSADLKLNFRQKCVKKSDNFNAKFDQKW